VGAAAEEDRQAPPGPPDSQKTVLRVLEITLTLSVGVCVGTSKKFERFCRPGVKRCLPDANLMTRTGQSSIFSAYNSMLDEARLAGVEILILMHDDVELRDPKAEQKLRSIFKDETIAVVGVVGGRGGARMNWWNAPVKLGRAPDPSGQNDYGGGTHEVDVVDGLLLALSPWAIENLRFDESTFFGFHGYDADICSLARSLGRCNVVVDLDIYHHAKISLGDAHDYYATELAWTQKWWPHRHGLIARMHLRVLLQRLFGERGVAFLGATRARCAELVLKIGTGVAGGPPAADGRNVRQSKKSC